MKKLNRKIAKWLLKHGETLRKDMPKWVPSDLIGDCSGYHVFATNKDADGYPLLSPTDLFVLTEKDKIDYFEDRKTRIHEFRDWLEPIGVVISNIFALISLVVSILALLTAMQA